MYALLLLLALPALALASSVARASYPVKAVLAVPPPG